MSIHRNGRRLIEKAYRQRKLTTATRCRVAHVVLGYVLRFQSAFPSLDAIADKARCSVATVKRGLDEARACGLLSWTKRWKFDAQGRPHRSSSLFHFASAYSAHDDGVDTEYLHTPRHYKEQWRPKAAPTPLPGPLSDALLRLGEAIASGKLR